MTTLVLTESQVHMLREVLNSDMDMSEHDSPDYTDEGQMQYHLDRCLVYKMLGVDF